MYFTYTCTVKEYKRILSCLLSMEPLEILICVARDVWDRFVISQCCLSFIRNGDDARNIHSANSDDIGEESLVIYSQKCSCSCVNIVLSGSKNHLDTVGSAYSSSHIGQKSRLDNIYMDGYLLSLFVNVLRLSWYYRMNVISHLVHCQQAKRKKSWAGSLNHVVIQLQYPQKDIIDYAWNERMQLLTLERRELDNAMSWLSTLGGAFSALGDYYDHCAQVAGRISVQQMRLALRLGDPMTEARCRLYLALSLLQRGYLKRAKNIILQQYQLARAAPITDQRLIRMCQGTWAKLKYMYRINK